MIGPPKNAATGARFTGVFAGICFVSPFGGSICPDRLRIGCSPATDKGVAEKVGLRVLVNNASSFYPTEIGEITESQWDDLVGSNLKAPLFLSQAASSALRLSRLHEANGWFALIRNAFAFSSHRKE